MGEYAEIYTLQTFGVDISESRIVGKPKWKWSCPVCGKNLASKLSQSQHIRDKHKSKGEPK